MQCYNVLFFVNKPSSGPPVLPPFTSPKVNKFNTLVNSSQVKSLGIVSKRFTNFSLPGMFNCL